MRLLLSAKDTGVTAPPDLWVIFQETGVFNIAAYVASGYTTLDSYIVGAGGAGGRGGYGIFGSETDPTKTHTGGGGGGGGGGSLVSEFGVSLLSLPASNPVVVGVGGYPSELPESPPRYGGYSSFNDLTAWGGGPGGIGGDATLSANGTGGGGGSGGGVNATGAAGSNGTAGGTGGAGGFGPTLSGAGGSGGYDSSHHGVNGGDATSDNVNHPNIFGGGGGGGGGFGLGTFTPPGEGEPWTDHTVAGYGGNGDLSSGGAMFGSILEPVSYLLPNREYSVKSGYGAGGGGGVNLEALVSYLGYQGKGLMGNWFGTGVIISTANLPGAGGGGGGGGVVANAADLSIPGLPGANGCVLLRLYA